MAEPVIGLAVSRCARCCTISVWPRHACPSCGCSDFITGVVDGRGVIHAVTHVHRAPVSDGGTNGPYAIGMITLDAGGRLMARVSLAAAIGDPVCAVRSTVDEVPIVLECADPGYCGMASA